ncbi:MAG TPA: hypothetical protein VE614_07410 [Streptomyces sp.]|nr:hypothetical protein [Streptomyces sp.]HZF88211.1 hypothetical protein [Streptomyces sp.]
MVTRAGGSAVDGRPEEVWGQADANGGTCTVRRDAFGQPYESVDPAGSVTRLEWTADGWPTRRTAPDGSSEQWTYDEEGNCLTRQPEGPQAPSGNHDSPAAPVVTEPPRCPVPHRGAVRGSARRTPRGPARRTARI